VPEFSIIAIAISATALAVSLITMWVTLFRRGALKMTQPTTVMFGPDGERLDGDSKVYLRALLYSTAKRGHVIENMFIRLSRGEHRQSFPIWVLGDERLARGSGLFVGEQGVVANHHFLLAPDSEKYIFRAGAYRLEVFARLVGETEPTKLWSSELAISNEEAAKLAQPNCALYFDWGPDSDRYISTVKSKPPMQIPHQFLEAFNKALPDTPPTEGAK